MAIAPENVKIYEPERLSDESDGGGRATGRVVVDREVNNLFPDISRVDRTAGDVGLRKFFVGVDTANRDAYLGVHAIITEPPEDENVSVLLFDAGSESDVRADARNRIESYVVPGWAAPWYLQGDQFAGQRAIVGFQIKEAQIPEVGEVFLLRDLVSGNEQYIRIAEIKHELLPYTIAIGGGFQTFERRRLDISLTSTLEHTFPGGTVRPDGPAGDHTDVLTTKVAAAAKYWGVAKAIEAVSVGATKVKVDSVFKPVVPSAQKESPVLDQPAGSDRFKLIPGAATGDCTLGGQGMIAIDSGTLIGYLPTPVEPGSLTVRWRSNRSVYTDNGDGTLSKDSGTDGEVFTVDYATGTVRATAASGSYTVGSLYGWVSTYYGRGWTTFEYKPAARVSGRTLAAAEPVDNVNRVLTYVKSFAEAKPEPGTLVFSYRSLGKWYDIFDAGRGQLDGAGVGSVDFATGTVNVTLEALPDPDSFLLWSYVPNESAIVNTLGGQAGNAPQVVVDIPPDTLPGSVNLTFKVGGTTFALSDSGSIGSLTGTGGSGTVDYGANKARFVPVHELGESFDLTLETTQGAGSSTAVPMANYSGGVLSGTIPDAPLRPGSVSITALVNSINGFGRLITREKVITDDSAGGWPGFVGTVDYSSGVFNVGVVEVKSYITISYGWKDGPSGKYWGKITDVTSFTETPAGDAVVRYQSASATTVPQAAGATPYKIELIVDAMGGRILPGSLIIKIGDYAVLNDKDGVIYRDYSAATAAASAFGTVDYATGLVTLNSWVERSNINGVPFESFIYSGVSVSGKTQVDHVAFRTPGAPLNPGSVAVVFTDIDGNVINETANVAGEISGAKVQGTVDNRTGLVDLTFTDGTDPVYVFPESGRYNAVIVTSLPLDASLIGLDPVRLPSDGRVPIYREGDIVVIHHKSETAAATLAAGQVIATGRTHIAMAWIEDSARKKLNPSQYTIDKSAGTLTLATPLVLRDAEGVDLTPPFKVYDRIEHMTMINGVDITGEISFIAPSGHAFPANETWVSSAKIWGDVNARYFNFFTQRTWNSGSPNWTGARIGADTTANYNVIDNPVEIANRGAITEKWAILFTSSTSFNLVGSELGIIATGNTSTDLAPVNQNTGFPYFVVRAAGWGAGWSAGNVIRFDTEGCLAPGWVCRTVLSGQGVIADDEFELNIRGDAE